MYIESVTFAPVEIYVDSKALKQKVFLMHAREEEEVGDEAKSSDYQISSQESER